MMHVISLDSDLLFKTDIKQLFGIFDNFKGTTIFGLAREQQPVYRHILHMFRDKNPGTKAGEPPPDGLTGFNSGVILINLRNMRESRIYNLLLHNNAVKEIADKYTFQGHLGDQDFYTLLNLEYSALFHILPCSWNRQLVHGGETMVMHKSLTITTIVLSLFMFTMETVEQKCPTSK